LEDSVNKISLKNELIRKSIHLSSSIIPISYYFFSRDIEIIILLIISFLLVLTDLLRMKSESFRNFYLTIMKPILRGHEIVNNKSLFTGGTYIVLAFLFCVIIFPKPIAITSMFVVIFCDSFAAIIGKHMGKNFISSKTIEGALAFFICGVIIILLTPKITDSVMEYYLGFIAIFFSTIFELAPIKIDDNISTPIFFGFVYLILIKVFL
jgi:phytol kinase